MSSVLNRRDFQKLTEVRFGDAEALLKARRYDAAYYVAGYAVECALKACIAKGAKRHDFADKGRVLKSYTHNLENLESLAFENGEFEQERNADTTLAGNWGTVKEWSQESRYEQANRKEARELVAAIGDKAHGVLQCIRKYW